MDIEQFIALVAKMRQAQRIYFTTRSTEALSESKKIEREVDRWLAERTNTEQGKLW